MAPQASKLLLDTYTRKARYEPGLLVVLPLALAAIAWFPDGVPGWSLFSGVVVTCGGAALLSQMTRDRGQQKQASLWESWGGPPTTQLLRYRGNKNKLIVQRRHNRLKALAPDSIVPTQEDELKEPARWDDLYENWTSILREKTRDEKKFPLVFKENCNYGFRRNLWGMKPIGILFCALSILLICVLGLYNHLQGVSSKPIAILAGALDLALLTIWTFWITPSWVRLPAFAYGERLLEASESLS